MEAATNVRRRTKGGSRARNRAARMEIPAFGDWDFLQDDCVPITQYFDYCSAKQRSDPNPPPPPTASVYACPVVPVYYYAAAAAAAADDDYALFPNSMFPSRHEYDSEFHGLCYHYPGQPLPPPPPSSRKAMRGGGPGRQVRVKEEYETRGGGRRRERRHQRRSCFERRNRMFDVTATTEEIPTPSATTETSSVVVSLAELDEFHNTEKSCCTKVEAKDEDLYKIPPELLRSSKPKKKMSKFFTKCFMTICASY